MTIRDSFGLMQITQEKCAGSSNCSDPDFNIGVGAKYFADVLAQSGGNVLLALGTYNGCTYAPTLFRSGTDEVGIRDSRDVIQFCERDQESVLPVRQQPRLPSTVSQRTFLSTPPAEPKLMEYVHRAGYWDSTEATLVPTATPSASVLSLSVLNWIVGIPSSAGLVDTTCTAHSIFLLSCLQFAILFLLLFPLLAPPFSNHLFSPIIAPSPHLVISQKTQTNSNKNKLIVPNPPPLPTSPPPLPPLSKVSTPTTPRLPTTPFPIPPEQ